MCVAGQQSRANRSSLLSIRVLDTFTLRIQSLFVLKALLFTPPFDPTSSRTLLALNFFT